MTADPIAIDLGDPELFRFTWSQAPWSLYLATLDIDPEAAAHVAEMPFRALPAGDLISLSLMARETGTPVEDCAESQMWLAHKGYIRWDGERQGVWLTLPADPPVPPAFRRKASS